MRGVHRVVYMPKVEYRDATLTMALAQPCRTNATCFERLLTSPLHIHIHIHLIWERERQHAAINYEDAAPARIYHATAKDLPRPSKDASTSTQDYGLAGLPRPGSRARSRLCHCHRHWRANHRPICCAECRFVANRGAIQAGALYTSWLWSWHGRRSKTMSHISVATVFNLYEVFVT